MSAKLFETLETRQLQSASPAVVAYMPDYNTSDAVIAKIDYSTVNQINYFSVVPSPAMPAACPMHR